MAQTWNSILKHTDTPKLREWTESLNNVLPGAGEDGYTAFKAFLEASSLKEDVGKLEFLILIATVLTSDDKLEEANNLFENVSTLSVNINAGILERLRLGINEENVVERITDAQKEMKTQLTVSYGKFVEVILEEFTNREVTE